MSPSAASRSARNPRERARRRDVEVNHGVRRNAEAIKRGFDEYRVAFSRITRRAKMRFEQRNWSGMLADARVRLDLHDRVVKRVIADVRSHAHVRERDTTSWAFVKQKYAELIAGNGATGIAETFFNSVTRRLFDVVGVDPTLEFVDFVFQRIPTGLGDTPYRTYASIDGTEAQVCELLADYRFDVPFRDMIADAKRIAERIDGAWERGGAPLPFEVIEIMKPVFYRRKGAYLIGRARGGPRVMPLAISLRNGPGGVYADAVLLGEEDLCGVFSFARSYFQVDVDRPGQTIEFLRSLMPQKPVSELTSILGFDRHGKSEQYRHLLRYIDRTAERFETVPGTPGSVMAVFGMPEYNMVLKVIRDDIPPARRVTREDVRQRYRLVARYDRAGRLLDPVEFDHLVLARNRFTEDLLEELIATASRSVSVHGQDVSLDGVYTLRRVQPLDVWLRNVDGERRGMILGDYMQAIVDLAATGWFPEDLSFKNFGVTRLGRVVFTGYDGLRRLEDCTFRELPEVTEPVGEPATHSDERTVFFPERFTRFVALPPREHEEFISTHAELFKPIFWQLLQDRHGSGEVVDMLPYLEDRRIWLA